MELLVILFLYNFYAHINIFKHIEEKYGQSEIKLKDYSKTTYEDNKDKV